MTEKVIRIRIPKHAPDKFLDDLIAALQDAVRVISAQHYGKRVDEEQIEIAVGQLYHVKHEAEKHLGRKMRRVG